MSFRLTLVLLVILAALGAVVFFVDQAPPTPTPAAGSTTIISFLSSDATELSATSKDRSVLVVKEESAGWLLKQPESAPADQVRVEGTVSRLASLTSTRTIAAPADLGEFGLVEPEVEVKVTLKSGKAKTLLLGDQSPDKAAYYVKLPDRSDVYLVASSVGADLSQLVTNPPKATPTPEPGSPTPAEGTPTSPGEPAGTPTSGPATSEAPTPTSVVLPTLTPILPAPPANLTPEADAIIPQLPPSGTVVIPDLPLPPGVGTPTPQP
jgi:hypothetical protein